MTYGDDAANVLYHVVNDRHIRERSMLFTTNKHPKRWGRALHDEDLAEAIVDRILERGRLLRLDGPSVRPLHLPGDERAGEFDPQKCPGKRAVGTAPRLHRPQQPRPVQRRRLVGFGGSGGGGFGGSPLGPPVPGPAQPRTKQAAASR